MYTKSSSKKLSGSRSQITSETAKKVEQFLVSQGYVCPDALYKVRPQTLILKYLQSLQNET